MCADRGVYSAELVLLCIRELRLLHPATNILMEFDVGLHDVLKSVGLQSTRASFMIEEAAAIAIIQIASVLKESRNERCESAKRGYIT